MDFLLDGREGLVACADIPVRNFRLFFAVKIPGSAQHMPTPEDFDHPKKMVFLENVQRQIGETLRGAKLYPRAMRPGQLLDWLRRLFNSYGDAYPEPERNLDLYDERRLLNEQVINADTVIREHGDSMQIGDRYFACMPPLHASATLTAYFDARGTIHYRNIGPTKTLTRSLCSTKAQTRPLYSMDDTAHARPIRARIFPRNS